MYSYYANNSIIQILTDDQLEAAYRVRQMQYRTADVKAHAIDMLDSGNLTFAQFFFVVESAQDLAEMYIYKWHDCNEAENDVMVSMIKSYCSDHEQEIRNNEDLAYPEPVTPDVLLKIATGKTFPENTSLEKVAEIFDAHGLSDLLDLCVSDMDEATLNLSENLYLLPVSFEDPLGGGHYIRMFEITQHMFEKLLDLFDDKRDLPEWALDMDKIDQDCIEQYGVLLGRPLQSYAEYIEIDDQIDEMILEWGDPEAFFTEYPALERYRAGVEEKTPLDAQIGLAAQRSAGVAEMDTLVQEPEH